MRKLIGSLVVAIIAGCLGIGAWMIFKDKGPRERIETDNGTKIIVEELSYYKHGGKIFGKVFKPADEEGNFDDSQCSYPAVIFFHAPLQTSFPQNVLSSLASRGIIGYMSALHKDKNAETVLKRITDENFIEKDLVFFVADSPSSAAALQAAAKNRKKVAGIILIAPEPEAVNSKDVQKYGKEPFVINNGNPQNVITSILGYLEANGALK